MLKNYQVAEIDWWKQYTVAELKEERKECFRVRNKVFDIKEKTVGLDYGCGPLSMFEGSEIKYDAIDPLIEEYRKLIDLPENHTLDTDKKYDWVWCVNVIDHDENPKKIIDDIKSKLKPGGKLYFQVNLTDFWCLPHPVNFKEEHVDELLKDFKCIWKKVIQMADYQEFYALYEI